MSMEDMLRGKEPFFLDGADDAVLCLHGFTGSPGNYRKLARRINEEGFAVSVPALPGHSTSPADMALYSAEDWYGFVLDEYKRLRERYKSVHVIGLSLGGALAVRLAAQCADVASLILMAPAFAVNPRLGAYLGLDKGGEGDRLVPLPARKPDGGDMDECIFGYDAFPLSSAVELRRAGKAALEHCSQVKAPTLYMYTAVDKVVDAETCRSEAQNIPGVREIYRSELSEHNMLLGEEREEVTRRSVDFLLRNRD